MIDTKEIGTEIECRLKELIKNPVSELNYSNPFELLIAVMLSAQCTDKRVNIITEELFKCWKTPKDFANLEVSELEEKIKSCNYYHNKSKNIISACKTIVEKFNGQVPSSHVDLLSLSGVGNKTANVIEAVAFNKQALAVDTHVLRVSNRLGLVKTKNPSICENELKKIFKSSDLRIVHHLLLLFGRYHCAAKKFDCANCVLKDLCEYYKKG